MPGKKGQRNFRAGCFLFNFPGLRKRISGANRRFLRIILKTKNRPISSAKGKNGLFYCKGRLKSIFLFLVQKGPQLIKQDQATGCQLPVQG